MNKSFNKEFNYSLGDTIKLKSYIKFINKISSSLFSSYSIELYAEDKYDVGAIKVAQNLSSAIVVIVSADNNNVIEIAAVNRTLGKFKATKTTSMLPSLLLKIFTDEITESWFGTAVLKLDNDNVLQIINDVNEMSNEEFTLWVKMI